MSEAGTAANKKTVEPHSLNQNQDASSKHAHTANETMHATLFSFKYSPTGDFSAFDTLIPTLLRLTNNITAAQTITV